MKIIVASPDYPGPDLVYGDVFVHARVKEYRKLFDVTVLGYNPGIHADRIFEHEGITVHISRDLEIFKKKIIDLDPDLLAIHFVHRSYISFLIDLNKPIVFFVHGFEVLSWKRRLMNYKTVGDLRYLIPYIISNIKQRSVMRRLVTIANRLSHIRFVFVSNWLKKAAESDLKTTVQNAAVIPNVINLETFRFHKKKPDLRKKILLIRSFIAVNYANDLSVDAILLLSKRPFFNELSFAIYGEGYLFAILTEPLRSFSNVSLNNFFVKNIEIPQLHEQHGIFLCPSRLDTQGVSMCEAMASGLVPITSPVGGIPEFATDRISSYQVSTASEIAERIEFLYHNPEEFVRMSEQARQSVEDKCGLKETISKEMDLFQSLTRHP